MQWQPLLGLHVETFFSKELRQKCEATNERIVAITEARQAVDQKLETLRTADVEEIDFDQIVGVPSVQLQVAELLKQELTVRLKVAELLAEIEDATRKAHDKAIEAHEKAQGEVREKLLSIGYLETPSADTPTVGRIIPAFILNHPDVYAAMSKARGLHDKLHDRARAVANESAIGEVQERLRRIREKSVTVA